MVFTKVYSDIITTAARKKSDSQEILNPIADPLYVTLMEFSLDAAFSKYGQILILINGNTVLQKKDAGGYLKTQSFSIPMKNQKLLRGHKVEIFVWNGVNDSVVTVSYRVIISADGAAAAAAETPLSTQALNREISDTHVDQQTQFTIDKLDEIKNAIANQEVNIMAGDVSVDVDQAQVVAQLQAILAALPASPSNTDTIAAINQLIAALPESPDNADIIAKLNDVITALPTNQGIIDELTLVKNAIDGIELDVTTGAINLNQDQVIAKLNDVITALPASPNNADIIAQLNTIHNLLFTSDTNIINILHEVRDGLPASPDNADVVAGLNAVIAALPNSPNNADIVAGLNAVIAALPDNPNSAGIIARLSDVITELGTVDTDITTKLTAVIAELETVDTDLSNKLDEVKNSVDNVSIANESIPQAIRDILLVRDNPATPADHRTQLTAILNAVLGLQDGFDLDELQNAIAIFKDNIEGISVTSEPLSVSLESLFFNLEVISKNPSLTPSLTSFLFPKRVYRNETQYALVNTKGNRNLIVLMGASNIAPATNLNYDNGISSDTDFNYEVLFPQQFLNSRPEGDAVLDLGEQTINKEFETRFDFGNEEFGTGRIFNFFPTENEIENIIDNADLPIPDPHIQLCVTQFYPIIGNTDIVRLYSMALVTTAHITRTFDVFESEFEDFSIENKLLDNVNRDALEVINGSKNYVRIVEKTVFLIKTTGRVFPQTENYEVDPALLCENDFQTGTFIIPKTTFGNIADSGIVGGAARLSFEVKDADNEWYEHIASDEIGSITQGQKTIFEIGEAVSGHVLPSYTKPL